MLCSLPPPNHTIQRTQSDPQPYIDQKKSTGVKNVCYCAQIFILVFDMVLNTQIVVEIKVIQFFVDWK